MKKLLVFLAVVAAFLFSAHAASAVEVQYYLDGNLQSWYDSSWGMTFIYEDLDYYDCAASYNGHGRGRVVSEIQVDSVGETTTRMFEYYGDTLNLKNEDVTKTDGNGNVISDEAESYIYYENNLWANPSVSTDAAGNRYVSALIPDESGNWKARVTKYNSSGISQWVAEYDAGGSSAGTSVINALDAGGNVYLVSKRYDGPDAHLVVYKFDADGNQAGAPYISDILGNIDITPAYIRMDSSNNIYILGMSTTGNSPNNSLVLIKLNSDLTQQWVISYTTGDGTNGDHGGYLNFDSNGNIVLHGAQHKSDAFPEYYQVTYDTAGNQISVAADPIDRCFNIWSPWCGRGYKDAESDGTWYSLGFVEGTETAIVERSTLDFFPEEYGIMTNYNFYDPATLTDIGAYVEFANGVKGEARFRNGDGDSFYITKIIDSALNTTWFLWNVD